MFFPDLGLRIQKQHQKRGVKKNLLSYLFCAHKLKIIYFKMLKKKIWASVQRIIELFTQRFATELSKIWVWDLGSGIKTYSRSWIRVQGSKRHRIPDPGSGSATLPNRISKNYEKLPVLIFFIYRQRQQHR